MAGDGFFRIPGMINPEGLDICFYGFIVTMLISFVISAVLAYIVTMPKRNQEIKLGEPGETFRDIVYYHYEHSDMHVFMLFNEHLYEAYTGTFKLDVFLCTEDEYN